MVPGLILEEGGEEREGRKKEGGTEAGKKKGKEGAGGRESAVTWVRRYTNEWGHFL